MGERSLRIGVIARGLSEPIGGVKQYIYDITEALLKTDKKNKYCIFYNSNEFVRGYPNAEEVVINCRNKFLWDHFLLPRQLKRHALDLLFCPKNVVPLGVTVKSIVTIHDLLYFPIPGKINLNEYKFLDTLYMRLFIPRSVKQSVHIIADSHSTKEDVMILFKIPQGKISVVHLGVSSFAKRTIEKEKIRTILKEIDIRKPFIFYAGTATKRKNLSVLIKAMGMIRDKIAHDLVVTCGGSEKNVPLKKELKRAGILDRTRILGTVKSDELVALYKSACVFVFPSLYEGFGLPVLEAMAIGTPVICSNASSLPEVAGDAALLFDPHNAYQLKDCLLKLLKNEELRQSFIQKGLERAKQFTWEKAAQKMIYVFENHATVQT